MKVEVTVKDPDVLGESIEAAVREEIKLLNLPEEEAELLIKSRMDKAAKALTKWWEYSEYVRLEFDLDAMTARVIERK